MDFERENSCRVVKKRPTLTEKQLRKVVVYFDWFDSSNCYVTSNNFFRILVESFKQGCQYCILRVEMNIFRNDIFSWNTISISTYFRILRKKILDIQRKKSRLSELHLICPEAKLYEKMFFLDSIQFYTFTRTVTKTQSKVRLKSLLWVLQTALYVSEWKIRTKWLSFEPFIFKFFSRLWAGKYPAVVRKPKYTRPDGPMKNEVLIRSSLFPKSFRNLKEIFRV